MKNYKLQLSEGFEVISNDELEIINDLQEKILKLYSSYGYQMVKTPMLEYMDVFTYDQTQKPELYNLINRHGEILSLSNDMTSSIARYISSLNTNNGIKRYSYCQDSFRYPKLYQGKAHQFTQIGLELINSEGIYSDCEIINLAYQTVKKCNIDKFMIHIGSIDFLVSLFKEYKISKENIDLILDSIQHKDYVGLKETLKASTSSYNELFSIIVKGGNLNYLKNLATKFENKESIDYLLDLSNNLKSLGISNIIFDFTICSYAKYYTGIVFQIYIDGIKEAILDGGRYDNLYKYFMQDYKSCGFGLNLSKIAKEYKNNKKNTKNIIYNLFDDESYLLAFKENNNLRKKGFNVITLYNTSLDEARIIAKNNNARLRYYSANNIREEL